MSILPRLTAMGLVDYMALAAGLIVGFALFAQPMQRLEDAIRKN
jgi:hypothetical protein